MPDLHETINQFLEGSIASIGRDPVIESKSITANGTYTAPEGVDGYSPITVNVPLPQNAYLLKSVANLPQAIASFNDGEDMVMPSLKVAIEPQQEGSGDPSPTHIRPISGWDEVDVTVADDVENPTVSNVYTIDLDGTRYGGEVDVVNGSGTDTLGYVDLSEVTAIYNSGWNCWTIQPSVLPNAKIIDNNNTPTTAMTDRFKAVKASGYTTAHESGTIAQNTSGIWFIDNGSTTELSGQLVYELATPQTYQLTPTAVKSLLGSNNVWADTGNIKDVEYFSKEV